jgi:AcrR family transcriptional regulator
MVNAEPAEVSSTRSRILQISLSLMSQRGVDGTSMRDLAAAAGLNVASLYHYFPSKRDLLEAVLVEHGFLPMVADAPPTSGAQASAGVGHSPHHNLTRLH